MSRAQRFARPFLILTSALLCAATAFLWGRSTSGGHYVGYESRIFRPGENDGDVVYVWRMGGLWSDGGRLMLGTLAADVPDANPYQRRVPGRPRIRRYFPPGPHAAVHVVSGAGDARRGYWIASNLPRRRGPFERVEFIQHRRDGPPNVLGHWSYLAVPHWLILGVTALPPAWWLVGVLVPRRGLIRLRCGLCPTCGYDLRATPERCPECGTIKADAAASLPTVHVGYAARAVAAAGRLSLVLTAVLALLLGYAAVVNLFSLAPRPVAEQLFYLDAYLPLGAARVPVWAPLLGAAVASVLLLRPVIDARQARWSAAKE